MGKVKYIIFLLKMLFHDFKPGKGLEFTADLGIIPTAHIMTMAFPEYNKSCRGKRFFNLRGKRK